MGHDALPARRIRGAGMKAVLKKVDGYWVILAKCKDGTFADYRFRKEEDAWVWAHLVGADVEVVR